MFLGVAVYCFSAVLIIMSTTSASSPQPINDIVSMPQQPSTVETDSKATENFQQNRQPTLNAGHSIGQNPSTAHSVDKDLKTSPTTLQYRERCWRANFSSPERRPVDHTPRPFLLGESAARCRGDIFLLIAVQSAVQHRARRDLIRATWAAITNIGGDRLQTVFFVGTTNDKRQAEALRRESDSRADMVQADFVDTYRNLTYKHLYALRWIAESCRSVRYVMKVDDDVVLNVFRLRESLRELVGSRTDDFFYCQVIRSKPIRNRRHKWYVAYEEWPGDRYPNYCKGFGYVMSFGLIEKLHQCAKWRRYFWVDDVFVSGDLAVALRAPRIQWEDGWGAKRLHPRLAGPEAAQMVLANADGNFMVPSLNRRVWRAIVRFSDWGWEDGDSVYSE